MPAYAVLEVDCSARRVAAPPMWKVRIVSWVPGSPIDCAAMTPHRLADGHLAAAGQVAAVALDADAALGLAGEHRADLHPVEAGVLDLADLGLVDLLVGARPAPRR